MRILVTGGAGYVGGFAARHLTAAGHEVSIVDNLSEGHRASAAGEHFYEGEIGDRALVTRVVKERGIEAVMHFAAFAYVGVSVEDPRSYYRNNVAETLSLLESLIDAGVSSVIFSSTCSTYGETNEMPLTEESAQAPANPYAFTKYCIERMIRDFSAAYEMKYVLLRYFNAAGAAADGSHGEDHRPETHLIPLVLQTLLGQRESVKVFGSDYPTPDGTCVRDYVHVEDLARIHELAASWCLEAPAGGGEVFNVGTGCGSSVLDVIRSAESVTGKRVPHEFVARRPGDPPRLVASCDKAQAELGWRPRYTDLDEIVRTAWAWHEGHPNGYGDASSNEDAVRKSE